LLNCKDLRERYGDDVLLITGPALGPEGSLMSQAVANEIPLHCVDSLRRPIHPWRDLVAYREIRRVLRDFQPDVVHTHSAKGGILGRYAARALGVRAIVHTVHGAPFHPYQSALARGLFRKCEQWAAKRCHHLISVADAMTDLMVNSGVAPRQKFTTVYSGMDVDSFLAADQHRDQARQALGYQPDDIVVGKIARLFRLKGHEDVLLAAGDVIRKQPKVKFLFVGDGELKDSVQRRINDMGLQDHFIITGLVAPEKVPEMIGAMDMLIHTSLREGLPRTLPQALIAGRPVISYDIDGAREVAIEGVTGHLIPPQDTAALATCILHLANDADARTRMGGEGRKRFTECFRHENMTARLRAIYQRLLDGLSVNPA
ncbi:MAG TPA: glycosyltransferase family 4 protein, partial [Pirellulales bacterium]|nr:glycosyltransferase family 4 protein [Pirellulales bacterium]